MLIKSENVIQHGHYGCKTITNALGAILYKGFFKISL